MESFRLLQKEKVFALHKYSVFMLSAGELASRFILSVQSVWRTAVDETHDISPGWSFKPYLWLGTWAMTSGVSDGLKMTLIFLDTCSKRVIVKPLV